MREIAEQLSMTKAALYYHFDSKEDIVRALLAELEAEVEELTSWACSQPPGSQLRRDVLARWSDIMQARGLVLVRFLFANRSVVREVRPERGGMFEQLRALFDHLLSPDAGVEEQLRMRMAFLAVNLAGVAGADIDAPEAEILDAARVLARDILPRAE
jgi:AcrR family transcriptional regulator